MRVMSAIRRAFGLAAYLPHLHRPRPGRSQHPPDVRAGTGRLIPDYLMRRADACDTLFLIIAAPAVASYLQMRWFALTIVAVVVVDVMVLRYADASFIFLVVGVGTLHPIYVLLRNECAGERRRLCACAPGYDTKP